MKNAFMASNTIHLNRSWSHFECIYSFHYIFELEVGAVHMEVLLFFYIFETSTYRQIVLV